MTATAATLTPELASGFARLALAHVRREYPHKLDHVLRDETDVHRSPRELHPLFYGSFDWHSCVHGYWLLATVLRRFPSIPESPAIRILLDAQITAPNVAAELVYLAQPMRAGFERPYGWGWVLMLAAELRRHTSADERHCAALLQPLADLVVARFLDFLPRATYPVRVGTHYNTAVAIRLALEYADLAGDVTLADGCRRKAVAWYMRDADCQAWEPSGDDFLSSALVEAECMRVVLAREQFLGWLGRFLPRLARREPLTLFTPAVVSDRSDGKIAHLDGLNLSRAWCWRSLVSSFPDGDGRSEIAMSAATRHLGASLPYLTGDYMGEHWLATFALLAVG